MKTISQVAKLTGISVRALQYYDEIGLLKPDRLTDSGYRLYDDTALETLQQILFFKELGFPLKEIKEILQKPQYDKIAAFQKQKSLLLLKQKRIEKLIALLSRLEKGEQCMSFVEFDLSEYVQALENFKASNTENIVRYWGSVEKFNEFIQKVKGDESHLAQIAIKQFGSIEKYTEAMKYNLEHFSELMEQADKIRENKDEILQKNDALYRELTSDLTADPGSSKVQDVLSQIMEMSRENNLQMDMGEGYWDMVIESYSTDTVKNITDRKYKAGASDFIARALKHYFRK